MAFVTLIPAVFAAIAVLWIPGWLCGRLLGLERSWALCAAPLLSCAIIAMVCELLHMCGIEARPLVAFILPSVLLLVLLTWEKSRGHRSKDIRAPRLTWHTLALCATVGLVMGGIVFVGCLGSSTSFYQSQNSTDVVHHLGVTQAFADSGILSSFVQNSYMTAADRFIVPATGVGFYPSAYHAVCALVAMISGCRTATALNAVNYVLTSLVWPLASTALITKLFPNDEATVRAAIPASLVFTSFPWGFLVYGPLYPNLAGFAVTPTLAWILMMLTSIGCSHMERLDLAILFAFGLVGVVLLHPNVLFMLAIFVLPYYVSRLWHRAKDLGLSRWISIGVLVAVFICGYVAVRHVPAVSKVAGFGYWGSFADGSQTLWNAAHLAYTDGFFLGVPQYLLGILVLMGVARLFVERHDRWLPISYALSIYMVLVAATDNTIWRRVVIGFWYNDPYRIAAIASIFAVPLAAVGLSWLLQGLCELAHRVRPSLPRIRDLAARIGPHLEGMDSSRRCALRAGGQLLACAVVLLLLAGPPASVLNHGYDAFGALNALMVKDYRDGRDIDAQERGFIERCADLVGPEAVVLNRPIDGSSLAYPAFGMRVYYRTNPAGSSSETRESRIIRKYLYEYATRSDVRQAVRKVGATYVIKLREIDDGMYGWNVSRERGYLGIDLIDKDTPGFTLAAKSGDLALYRIDS